VIRPWQRASELRASCRRPCCHGKHGGERDVRVVPWSGSKALSWHSVGALFDASWREKLHSRVRCLRGTPPHQPGESEAELGLAKVQCIGMASQQYKACKSFSLCSLESGGNDGIE